MKRRSVDSKQATFQALLRKARIDLGVTQVDLAKKLGRPQSFVSKYEAGERQLGFVETREVCAAMGISLEELVRRFERAVK